MQPGHFQPLTYCSYLLSSLYLLGMLSPSEKERAERTSSDFDSRDGLLNDSKSDIRPPRDFEKQYVRLRLLNAFLAIALAVVSSCTLYLFIHRAPSDDILLGTDYFGYVPRRKRPSEDGPQDENPLTFCRHRISSYLDHVRQA